MLNAELCKKKTKSFCKTGEQQPKVDLAGRPGAYLLTLGHGAGGGEPGPPNGLSSSTWG